MGEAFYFGPVMLPLLPPSTAIPPFWLTITAILPFFGGNVNRIGEILFFWEKRGKRLGDSGMTENTEEIFCER